MSENQQNVRTSIIEGIIASQTGFSLELLKWVIANSFILNGSALVVALGVDEIRPFVLALPGLLTGLGLLCALFAGLLTGVAFSSSSSSFSQALWNGDVLENEFGPATQNGKPALCLLIAGFCLIGLAVIFFLVGVALFVSKVSI